MRGTCAETRPIWKRCAVSRFSWRVILHNLPIAQGQNVVPELPAHGARIPSIGFGTSQLGDCGEVVATALKLGYRHVDTAWKYGTEKGVGEGIRVSGVPRKDIFLTTKVSHEYLRADDFARSVDASSISFDCR